MTSEYDQDTWDATVRLQNISSNYGVNLVDNSRMTTITIYPPGEETLIHINCYLLICTLKYLS